MTRDQAIHRLLEHRPALRSLGVTRAALLRPGARTCRDTNGDLDIMVEFDPAAHVGVYGYVEVAEYIKSVIGEPVEITDRDALTYNRDEKALDDAVYAF